MVKVVTPLATAVLLAVIGCTVDRRTPSFECDDNSDCEIDRRCDLDTGYCVLRASADCPDACTSCGLFDPTECNISCNSSGECASVECPAGYHCNVQCTAPEACGDIDCTDATACDVSCSSGTSCGDITCGQGRCSVQCVSPGACGEVECSDSCSCSVTCMAGNCAATSCPSQGALCTEDGTSATPCAPNANGCNPTCS
ncbi:MAG: hypothetical protein AB7O24_06735 [Kofleriaceae bacterium]